MASQLAKHATMYFASTVLRAILDCFLLCHEIMADPSLKQHPEVLFLSETESYQSVMIFSSPVRNKSSTYNNNITRSSFITLKYRLESTLLLVKPKLVRKLSILPYQVLGACFNPYRAFFNLQTYVLYFETKFSHHIVPTWYTCSTATQPAQSCASSMCFLQSTICLTA
jgi:hypothetical protein